MKPSRLQKAHIIPALSCALALLVWLTPRAAVAAVFDFTPLTGTISAVYVGGASGNVQLSVSGASQISVPTTSTQPPLINNGIVAWTSSSKVYYYVFDPALGQWKGGSHDVPAFAQDLTVAEGTVAWSTPAGAFCRVYDPAQRNWMSLNDPGAVRSPGVRNSGGVAVWMRQNSLTVICATYDPSRTAWRTNSTIIPGNTSDLTTRDGVVAWSSQASPGQYRVYLRIYDPRLGTWQPAQIEGGFPSILEIVNSRVYWSTSGGDSYRGYDGPNSVWGVGEPVPKAYFAVSTSAGNQPLTVHFIDMSLGATAWAWNFGNGDTSTRRSPTYVYRSFGRFNATLGVNNNSSTTNQTILTDVTLPVGTIAINGTTSGGFTTNRNVTLTLTATDNSGVTDMRFNNDNGEWGQWEAFATSRAWALNTNNGTRSVSAQFRDVALNTSATVTATIQLDTSPLPVISLVSTNTTEEISAVTVVAALDRTYSRAVAVSYTTSNGTATAGQDFDTRTGTLIFSAGTRTLTIPLTIRQDAQVELNETFSVHFTAISNVVAGVPGQITILDDDLATVSFAQPEYSEVESNGAAAITVRLDAASGQTIFVRYEATNGTATADFDYTPVSGELIFTPGVTNQTFIVPLINDPLDEFPETVGLTLLTSTNAFLSATTNATLTILDDDKPVIFFSQATYPVYESNSASAVKISVRLSKPYAAPVHVECEVAGVTAAADDDFAQPTSNIQLTFQPDSGAGSTNKDLTIIVRPDTIPEPQETIRLTLTAFAGGSPGPVTTAHVVITDNDAPPFMQDPALGTNGQFSATFIGFPGQVFALERSTNFIQWTEVVRLTNTTGTLNFSQSIPSNPGGQFFRTRLIP